jgi:protein TonB
MPEPQPPPLPTPSPVRILRISRVLNSEAIKLPKPVYPPFAIQIRQQGTVTVQVMIDETGNVISAKATSGPSLLIREAEKAALQARFSPTRISDQAVKVSGVITYNFILN